MPPKRKRASSVPTRAKRAKCHVGKDKIIQQVCELGRQPSEIRRPKTKEQKMESKLAKMVRRRKLQFATNEALKLVKEGENDSSDGMQLDGNCESTPGASSSGGTQLSPSRGRNVVDIMDECRKLGRSPRELKNPKTRAEKQEHKLARQVRSFRIKDKVQNIFEVQTPSGTPLFRKRVRGKTTIPDDRDRIYADPVSPPPKRLRDSDDEAAMNEAIGASPMSIPWYLYEKDKPVWQFIIANKRAPKKSGVDLQERKLARYIKKHWLDFLSETRSKITDLVDPVGCEEFAKKHKLQLLSRCNKVPMDLLRVLEVIEKVPERGVLLRERFAIDATQRWKRAGIRWRTKDEEIRDKVRTSISEMQYGLKFQCD